MTAINVLIEPNRVHVFADGGHHEGEILRHVGPKVYALPVLNMVFAWSGLSYRAEEVLEAVARARVPTPEQLAIRLPSIFEKLKIGESFSAFFVGVSNGVSIGYIVERKMNGELITHNLVPWSVVNSLPTSVEFDLKDIRGSGVRIMQDQKDRHKIVFAYVQHVMVDQSGAYAQILREWPDIVIPSPISRTHAAKITDLTVDTIKFDNNATMGVASRTSLGALTVPNVSSTPMIFSMMATLLYTGTAASAYAQRVMTITRTRGSVIVATDAYGRVGNFAATYQVGMAGLDQDSQNNDEYTLSSTMNNGSGGSISISNIIFKAVYRKK